MPRRLDFDGIQTAQLMDSANSKAAFEQPFPAAVLFALAYLFSLFLSWIKAAKKFRDPNQPSTARGYKILTLFHRYNPWRTVWQGTKGLAGPFLDPNSPYLIKYLRNVSPYSPFIRFEIIRRSDVKREKNHASRRERVEVSPPQKNNLIFMTEKLAGLTCENSSKSISTSIKLRCKHGPIYTHIFSFGDALPNVDRRLSMANILQLSRANNSWARSKGGGGFRKVGKRCIVSIPSRFLSRSGEERKSKLSRF